MADDSRVHWGRIVLAVIGAEALPVLVLVLIVTFYGFTSQSDSVPPEDFAPIAGRWVGPIAGFGAALLFAFWTARRASGRPIAHGIAVGAGAACLDVSIAALVAGAAAFEPLLLYSNVGRILAGLLGGWLAAHGRTPRKTT